MSTNLSNDNISWIQKYEPKTYDDLILNKDVLLKVKNWLQTFTNNYKLNDATLYPNTIMIAGPHGSGKNVSLKILLSSLNYEVVLLSSSDVKNKKSIDDIIQSYERRKDMTKLFNDMKKKLALIIDDTETINLTNEKNSLLELCKFNNTEKVVPIIFIANTQKGKLITNIQKICTTYEFQQPTKNELTQIMIKIMMNENMKVSEQKVMNMIIEYSQSDIRRLIYIIQDLYITFAKSSSSSTSSSNLANNELIITLQNMQQYANNFQKKDVEIALFDATRIILDNYKSVNQCMALYDANKVKLPLSCHENYYRKLFAATKSLIIAKQNPAKLLLNQLEICSKITDASSIGDNIETNIYVDQNWINQNTHGLYTVAHISYIMNNLLEKMFTVETPAQHKYIKEANYEVDHSLDLHKTSLKNINRKQIVAIKSYMPSKNLTDILYINKIIYDLIKNNRYKEAYELCKEYEIDIKALEVIIKIDKTSDKLTIKTKNKKLFS